MDKELCFVINGIKLYMEQILVEYDDAPIFYLCNGNEELYLVLREDVGKEEYIIVKPERRVVLDMLHGKISMRNAILASADYWHVLAQDNIVDDVVEMHGIGEIPLKALPYEDACYEVVTEEVQGYLEHLETASCATGTRDNDRYTVDYMLNTGLWEMVFETCTKKFRMSLKNYMEYQVLYEKYLNDKFDTMYTSGDCKISVSGNSEAIHVVTGSIDGEFALIAA